MDMTCSIEYVWDLYKKTDNTCLSSYIQQATRTMLCDCDRQKQKLKFPRYCNTGNVRLSDEDFYGGSHAVYLNRPFARMNRRSLKLYDHRSHWSDYTAGCEVHQTNLIQYMADHNELAILPNIQ